MDLSARPGHREATPRHAWRWRLALRALTFALCVETALTACSNPDVTVKLPPGTIGSIDAPADEAIVSNEVRVSGWALDPKGIRSVEIKIDGASWPATLHVKRPDVAAVRADYPDSAAAGFEFDHDFSDLDPIRHEIRVVAVNGEGRESELGKRSLVPPLALSRWKDMPARQPGQFSGPFYFLMATSGVASGGAAGVDTEYRDYLSGTTRIGIAVPILYLRTTKGEKGDWEFDPDFDLRTTCKQTIVAGDSLKGVMAYAVEKQLPVQFILNGGIWADANCNTPAWDVNDHLEDDINNCQWTQDNVVYPDDYLKMLAGSTTSPELARSLTYNVYATQVRHYKKRNLQAAARLIVDFAREHPDLFVGVNLDADTYMNPFFEQREWFDYNPGMIKQFRHWLRGSGPYAGKPESGVPDLSHYRRQHPLSLAEVNQLARRTWKSWDEVDPPRAFPGSLRDRVTKDAPAFWDDPWFHEWDTFRKHVVALHYDELAQWTHEVGIPKARIFSAQGFMAPDSGVKPFAIHIEDGGQNYDSAGVSIEGSIPRQGHLGAILYGKAAENVAAMAGPHNLFATFDRMDPGWAVVEFNSTDLKDPTVLPTYSQTYHALRDIFNYDGRQVSVMAWNGSNGIFAGQPGYVPYTAWRNTPAEEAMRDFLVSHANLPPGAKLWTFGSSRYKDSDGWTAGSRRRLAGRRSSRRSIRQRLIGFAVAP